MNHAPLVAVAEELVDSMLLGVGRRRTLVLKSRIREVYYEERHAEHDGLRHERKPAFNGIWSADDGLGCVT
jgi:hypothetical protein